MYNFLGQILGIALRSRVHLSLSFPSMIWKVLVGECLTFNDLVIEALTKPKCCIPISIEVIIMFVCVLCSMC